MAVHPLDFEIQADLYSTPEYTAIFNEKSRFQRWLQFEAALAHVQGEAGIIPAAAAQEIGEQANLDHLDLAALAAAYQTNRNSLVPVLNGLRQACRNGHGEYVHYGATTQDAIDTGQVLEIKGSLNLIYRDLRAVEATLLTLVERYRTTPMIGRTHSQQALPITFGFKAAVWLSEIRRHLERLKALAPRLLVGQLSGAVGTMAALGPLAPAIANRTMARLGLGCATITWHTARDNMAELGSCYAMLGGTLAKIGNEIFQLGKTEVGELREGAGGKGPSSSTMPHKRNPVLCERVVVLGTHIRALAGIIMEGMLHENERDPRALWSEWLAIPQISIYMGASLNYSKKILAGLEVNEAKMLANLHLQKDAISSEWLMFKLAKGLGKMAAQGKVQELLTLAEREHRPLRELLQDDPATAPLLTETDLRQLEEPERYTGQAAAIVQATLDEIRLKRFTDPESL